MKLYLVCNDFSYWLFHTILHIDKRTIFRYTDRLGELYGNEIVFSVCVMCMYKYTQMGNIFTYVIVCSTSKCFEWNVWADEHSIEIEWVYCSSASFVNGNCLTHEISNKHTLYGFSVFGILCITIAICWLYGSIAITNHVHISYISV